MKKIFTLLTLALVSIGTAWGQVTWPDTNFLLLDGTTSNKIDGGESGAVGTGNGSTSYTKQVGGTGATWSCNSSKYTYGSTSCTFYGNAFTKGLKHESATYTQVITTGVATLTIVQSLATNSGGTLDIETVGSNPSDKKDINSFNASNLIVNSYSGTQTIGGKTYKDVKVYKLCNLPAGTYKIYRGSSPTDQTYVVYMGVTYGTTSSYTITTATSNGGTSTVSGGGSKLAGSTATLTATPGAGKAFDHWELSGSNVSTDNPYSFNVTGDATYTAVFIDANTKNITIASSNDSYGEATGTATTIVEGGNTTLTATPKSEAYGFVNWTKSSDGSWSSTTNPLTIGFDDLTNGETYTANFKQLYKVTYAAGEGSFGTTGKVEKVEYAGIDDKITTWAKNYYISKDGATLTGWNDGTNTYALDEEITLTSNKTLTAVFTDNTKSLNNLSEAVDVTWTFDATPYVHVEGKEVTGYYVQQVTIDAIKIDVPMSIVAGTSASNGKFATSAGQVQAKLAYLTIPAVKGMKVVLNAKTSSNFRLDRVQIDGVAQATSSTNVTSHTYIYTGSNATLTILAGTNDNIYLGSIKVTYPVPSETVEVGEREWATFVSDKALDFTGSDVKAYIVTGHNDAWSAITKSDALTKVAANTPLLLNASKGTYVIPVAASGTDYSSTNKLKAGNDTPIAKEDGKTKYVLADDGTKATFFKINGEVPTVATGKAYLEFDGEPAGAREILLIDGDATAIKNIKVGTEDNVYYNLQGQRVLYPTKGLYIVNGKKVIIK